MLSFLVSEGVQVSTESNVHAFAKLLSRTVEPMPIGRPLPQVPFGTRPGRNRARNGSRQSGARSWRIAGEVRLSPGGGKLLQPVRHCCRARLGVRSPRGAQ